MTNGSDKRDRRGLMMGGVVLAAMLFVGIIAWPLLAQRETGSTSTTDNAGTMTRRGLPAQQAAQSQTAKDAGEEDASGGRARSIKQTSQPLQLSDEQRQSIARIIATDDPPQESENTVDTMIGSAVPKQTKTKPLPNGVAEQLGGHHGATYTLIGRKLVVIDVGSGRIGAIIPLN